MTHLFLKITRILLLPAMLFSQSLHAIEINELDEITMQVIDVDSSNSFDMQQIVRIPIPVNNENLSPVQSNFFAKPEALQRNTTAIIESKIKQ